MLVMGIFSSLSAATFNVTVNDGGWGNAATAGTLAKAIADFNGAGAGAHTINITTAVSLTDPAKWSLSNAAATLTINGNGNTVDGPGYNSWTINVNRITINDWTMTAGFGTAVTTLAGAGGHTFNNTSIANIAFTFTVGGNVLTNSTFSGPGGTYAMRFNSNNGNTITGCYFSAMALIFTTSLNNAISNSRFTTSGITFQTGSNDNTVYGCKFNTNAAGTTLVASLIAFDISINASTGNIIGGNTAVKRNVFALSSTNSISVVAGSTNTRIVGNYFGTDVTGLISLSGMGTNSTISINASQNVVVDSNVVSSMQGTTGGAIEMVAGICSGLKIRYNLIGVNASGAGAAAFANRNNGIVLTAGTANNLDIIGNTISRSANVAIRLNANINPMTIQNNNIGSNSTGLYDGTDYGNGHGAIFLETGTISNVTISNNVIVRNGWVTQDNISCGLYVTSGVNTITFSNNKIGVYANDVATGPSGNSFAGIFFYSTCSNITVSGNVIGRNGQGSTKSHGISTAGNITNINILNNYIGISPASAAIGNGNSGLDLQNVTTGTVSGNYICANEGRRTDIPAAGIALSNGTNQVSITGNFIGVAPNGSGAGQQLNGSYDGSAIRAEGTTNRISIHNNDLAYSAGNGVNVVAGADYVQIFDNRIYCNTAKGINLNCGGGAPNGPGNNSFGCGTITLNTFTPVPSSVSGGRPTNSVVYVYGTGLCASGICGPNPQGQTRFTGGTTSYPTASTWDYNHGSLMYNDITALAVGTGANCNSTYCRTSEFSNCVDNTLPVSLLSFDLSEAAEHSVLLTWTTISEINNSYFIIERSRDGINFEPIGKVNGQGNSNQLTSYSYTDHSAGTGVVYYRLKQVDLDGSYGYSEIKNIRLNADAIVIYPNPNSGAFTVSTHGGNYRIIITDIIGQKVYESEMSTAEKTFQTGLSAGTYLAEVVNENIHEIYKLVIE